jgi:hypothetical protein
MNEKDHGKMFALANHNIREHLFNVYHFFHSPYLYSKPIFNQDLIEKMNQIDKNYEEYCGDYYEDKETMRKPQFFDLLESAMAIHTLYYDRESSKIFNIFFHGCEDKASENIVYDYKNTLIYVRILQSIKGVENKEHIIERLRLFGYGDEALRNAINILLEKALIESVQGCREESITDISKSEKGKLYLSDLIKEYTYLLFVCDAVPMPDIYKEDILDKFGSDDIPLNRGSLAVKNSSVIKFIEFIKKEEEAEFDFCPREHRPALSEIRGDDGISEPMRACVNKTIEKMTKYSRGAQRRGGIKIISVER